MLDTPLPIQLSQKISAQRFVRTENAYLPAQSTNNVNVSTMVFEPLSWISHTNTESNQLSMAVASFKFKKTEIL